MQPKSKGEFSPNQEIAIASTTALGGFIGGVGNYTYNKAYNPQFIQGTIVSDGLSGLIAGYIGVVFIAYKLKKDFNLTQIMAIAMAIGLAFHAVFGGVKSVVNAQAKIYQLENAVEQEQQASIENLSAIAIDSKNPEIKKEAIAAISDIAERSENPEKPIEAIQDLAENSKDTVKADAVEQLSTIVESSTDDKTVESAIVAIRETATGSNEALTLQSLNDLQQMAIDTDDESKRKEIIFQMADFKGQYNQQIDLWLGAKLNYLHNIGKNNYLVFNERLNILERL